MRLVETVNRGQLLPGHPDRWACELRSEVEHLEIRIRRSVVAALANTDGAAALEHARRWVKLDPFSDEAHRTVHHLAQRHLGQAAATEYRTQTAQMYRVELQADLPADFDCPPARLHAANEQPSLPAKAQQLRDQIERSDPRSTERAKLVLELDNVLRLAGNYHEREALLSDFRSCIDPEVEGWRDVEIAVSTGDDERADTLLHTLSTTSDRGSPTAESMLAIAAAFRCHTVGENQQALEKLEAVLAGNTDAAVRLEAHLLMTSVFDTLGDLASARDSALESLELIQRHGLSEHEAMALAALGHALARSIYPAEAEMTLQRAHELATRSGSGSALASVFNVQAYINFINGRCATAYSYTAAASTIYQRNGAVHLFAKQAHAACSTARVYGDLPAIRYQFDALASLVERTTNRMIIARARLVESILCTALQQLDKAVSCLVEALTIIEKLDVDYWRFYAVSALVRLHLRLGRLDQALHLAEQNLDRAETLGLPPRQVEWIRGDLGCALIAGREYETGMNVLHNQVNHGNPNQILFALQYACYFEAARSTGNRRAAESTQLAARRMLDVLRQDLTPIQWSSAKRHSEFVRPLLGIVEVDVN